jgi:hypothetical protein
MEIQDELTVRLNNFSTAPFLFIGSGISRRYLGLPDLNELLKRFSDEMGKSYEYYYSKSEGDLPKVASLIAIDYHKFWFESENHSGDRLKYPQFIKTIDSPLKIEIAKFLNIQFEEKYPTLSKNEEIQILKKSTFDGIITTNYDGLLEELFSDYIVFIGQEGLIFSNPQSIGEIYKIHGSCSDPNSLVLTSKDYEKFDKRNAYLAAKLLTLFVEHPIIFLGYSLEDSNIQKIFSAISSCLTNDNIGKLKDRLIFIIWDEKKEGDNISLSSYVTKENVNIPITVIKSNEFSSVYKALGDIERKLPIRLLRQLKEQFYDFILNNDPSQKCKVVVNIEDSQDLSNIEFVVGVGVISQIAELGLRGITRNDLFDDLIVEDRHFNPEQIVQKTLPFLIPGRNYVPIFKYLRNSCYLNSYGQLIAKDLNDAVIQKAIEVNSSYFKPHRSYEHYKDYIRKFSGINDLRKEYDDIHLLFFIPLLDIEKIDTDELHDFLVDIRDDFLPVDAPNQTYRTYYKILCCLYDWIKYGAGDDLKIL